MPNPLIPPHGGYRNLKSFQVAQLIYDLTVRFTNRYINHKSRTRDQMVQAARSGVQNIAEGSQASATSKKTELKLTGVARASLEELRLDYEDFLRQRNLPKLPPNHPALMRFKAAKCATLADVQTWLAEEKAHPPADPHAHPPTAALVANAALSLLNITRHLLDRQISSLARTFLHEGGFTERLYHHRITHRTKK